MIVRHFPKLQRLCPEPIAQDKEGVFRFVPAILSMLRRHRTDDDSI